MEGLDVVLCDSVAQVRALQPAWDALLRDVAEATAAMSFQFAITGWETLAKTPEPRLAVVVVRRGDELLCVWPLYVVREGMVTVARHLGCGDVHEYAGPLVRENADTAAVVRAALQVVKRQADVIRIYNVRVGGQIEAVLAADATPKRQGRIFSPIAAVAGTAQWESHVWTLSRKLRAQLRHDRRQFEQMGDFQFRRMSGPVDGLRCLDFVFEQKRAWLDARRIRNSFVMYPQVRRFFNQLAANPPEAPPAYEVETYALTLDDRIVAACILLNSADRVEFYTTSFDPDFGDHGPGTLMIEDCVRLALSRGVDFDFRIARQEYKARWTNRYDPYVSFHLGVTPLGMLVVARDSAWATYRRLRVAAAGRVKAFLRQVRAKPA